MLIGNFLKLRTAQPRRLFMVDEYERMTDPRIFGPEDRTELIEGIVMARGEGTPWRFSTAAYYALAEVGPLQPEERTELIKGDILVMPPASALHAETVLRIATLLARRLGERVLLNNQNPVELGDDTAPKPDISLLKPHANYYTRTHPTSADVLLVVEVSDTTLEYDRDVKVRLYARAGIPETWVVDLNGERVIVFREVDNGEYTRMESVRRGADMTPSAFPDVTLHVDDILGEGRASG